MFEISEKLSCYLLREYLIIIFVQDRLLSVESRRDCQHDPMNDDLPMTALLGVYAESLSDLGQRSSGDSALPANTAACTDDKLCSSSLHI